MKAGQQGYTDAADLSWRKSGADVPPDLVPVDDSRPADPDNSIRIVCEKQLVEQLSGSKDPQAEALHEFTNYMTASQSGSLTQPKVKGGQLWN